MQVKTVKQLLFAALLTSVAACSNSDDSAPTSASAPRSGPTDVAYTAEAAAYTSDVVSFRAFPTDLGVESTQDLQAVYVAYPTLGVAATELATVDHSVMTTTGKVEMWAGSEIALVLEIKDGVATILSSRSGLAVERVTHTTGAEAQGARTSVAIFDLKACAAVVAPDQDQHQGKDKGEVKEPVCQTLSVEIQFKERYEKPAQEQEAPKPTAKPEQGK